jgi:hypothetical protein
MNNYLTKSPDKSLITRALEWNGIPVRGGSLQSYEVAISDGEQRP